MELLNQADRVVRTYLPEVLDAAGADSAAQDLRGLEPLMDRQSIVQACGALQQIRILGISSEVWESVVEEAAFWCEAAVMAAVRKDASAFRHHVEKANEAMRSGLPMVAVH